MKTYRVSFLLTLDDESGHPRKWVPESVYDALRHETGEDCDEWVFDELVDEKEAE